MRGRQREATLANRSVRSELRAHASGRRSKASF
jgi:hypothetical protein